MRSITYYYSTAKENDELTRKIRDLSDQKGVFFVDVCIDGDPQLDERFADDVPVVLVGPYRINSPFTITEVEVAINAILERDAANLEAIDDKKRFSFSNMEKFSLWFSRFYVWVITSIILLFVGFAFLAPVLMAAGRTSSAEALYRFYKLLCHQLFYRSFFIDGEQAFYPRELAGIADLKTFEEITGKPAEDLIFARNYKGNETLGFKIALCQRDIPIYLSMALFGIVFEATNRKIKPIKWYLWFIIALIPIGLDGFSQLPGLAAGWPAWLPIRESTPLLRVLTGTLFGTGTAWYMYPLMEEGMKETRFQLERKNKIVQRMSVPK